MKNKLLFVPLLLMPLALSSCFGGLIPNNNNNGTSEETSTDKSRKGKYYLNKASVDLVVGQQFTILLNRDEDDGTVKTFDNINSRILDSKIWMEDETIATVNEAGVITPIKEGTTTLFYRVGQDGTFATILECKVNIVAKVLDSISVKRYNNKMLINTEYTFKGTVNGIYTTGFSEPLPSTNIYVDTSKINISVVGEYPITVSASLNGYTKSIDLTVKVVASEEELIDNTKLEYSITDYESNSQFLHTTGLPVKGDLKFLVVPVKFTDSNTFITNYDNVKEDINTAFFGTSEQVGYESVKSFYEKESFDRVSITGKTANWFPATHPSTYYYDRNKQDELAYEIRDWYFANEGAGEDIKSYDTNHDKQFDGLFLVYGSPDYKSGALGDTAKNMWMSVNSHTTNPASLDINNPSVNRYMWASYDAIYPTEAKSLERTEKSSYSEAAASGENATYKILDTHTLIHETGHMFGLNDYYTYGGSTSFITESTMQSNTRNGHEPYSLLLYNWVDPIVVEDTGTYVIGDFQTTHDLLLVTPSWNEDNSPFDEYILIELYAPTGLNKFDSLDHPVSWNGRSSDVMSTVGIRMWHADKRLIKEGMSGFITNPTIGNVNDISSNTPSSNTGEYQDCLEIYLIRNDTEYDWKEASSMEISHFFQTDDVFTIEKYQSQFAKGTKLNNNQDFPFEIRFKSVDQLTKEAEIEIIRK